LSQGRPRKAPGTSRLPTLRPAIAEPALIRACRGAHLFHTTHTPAQSGCPVLFEHPRRKGGRRERHPHQGAGSRPAPVAAASWDVIDEQNGPPRADLPGRAFGTKSATAKKKEKEKRKEEWGVDRDSDSDTKLGARSIPRSLRKRGRRARQTINPEISRLAPVVGVRRAHRSPLYRWAFDQNKEIRGLDPDSNRALNKLLEFLPVLFRHPGKLHSDPKARSAGDDFAIRP